MVSSTDGRVDTNLFAISLDVHRVGLLKFYDDFKVRAPMADFLYMCICLGLLIYSHKCMPKIKK